LRHAEAAQGSPAVKNNSGGVNEATPYESSGCGFGAVMATLATSVPPKSPAWTPSLGDHTFYSRRCVLCLSESARG